MIDLEPRILAMYPRTLSADLTDDERMLLVSRFDRGKICDVADAYDQGDGYDGIVNRTLNDLVTAMRDAQKRGAETSEHLAPLDLRLVAHGSAVIFVGAGRNTLMRDEGIEKAHTSAMLLAASAHHDFWPELLTAARALAGWLLDRHDPSGLCAEPRERQENDAFVQDDANGEETRS